ncbi:MAG TPA: hypothetical protein VF026_04885 [Ktedonobacteraceae bacterium]
MTNPTTYYGAIVLGVLAVIAGVMMLNNFVLGYHVKIGYAALAVGVILVIVGIVGMFMARSRAS